MGNKDDFLYDFLSSAGLVEYYQRFQNEGFDRMAALYRITEQDMEQMKVKLGHRRILQHELEKHNAEAGPISASSSQQPPNVSSQAQQPQDQGQKTLQVNRNVINVQSNGIPAVGPKSPSKDMKKRPYIKHPKKDENAPEKPVTAYVSFSKTARNEFKDESFSQIAKLVGEKWKNLPDHEREKWERQAARDKEDYQQKMEEYRQTPEYTQYQEYLKEIGHEPENIPNKKKRTKSSSSSKAEVKSTPVHITSTPVNVTNSSSSSDNSDSSTSEEDASVSKNMTSTPIKIPTFTETEKEKSSKKKKKKSHKDKESQ